MGKRMIILEEEISIDVYELCRRLRDQAHSISMGSDAVDRIEWKAARVIDRLLYDIDRIKKEHNGSTKKFCG